MVAEEENTRPMKNEFRWQLFDLLKQGYLDDVDPSILYEDEKSSQLPGKLAKASEFLKRRGQIFLPKG